MKKLLYIVFLVSFLFMCFSKETNDALSTTTGSYAANNNYCRFSDIKSSQNCDFKVNNKKETNVNSNNSSFLPAYFWDTKMITW